MLSIIIPVYKTERYLPKCLESLLAQSYADWEAILVDDGSPDGSGELCDAYAGKDGRFRVIHQDNAGPGAARNHGLEVAQGEYVCFVDSDDWVGPRFLESVMAPAHTDKDILFWGYTAAYADREEERHVPERCADTQAEAWQMISELKQTRMFGYMVVDRFKRSVIEEHGIRFATDIKVHEDLCFTNEYCQHITSAACIDNTDYRYRMAEGGSLSSRFYPSDECMKIAQHLLASVKYHIDNDTCLAEQELYQYLSKLNLAVMNLFDPNDSPKKSYREKIERIRYVQSEIRRYYGRYASLKGTSHKIYKYLNAHLVCCYQSLFQYIR